MSVPRPCEGSCYECNTLFVIRWACLRPPLELDLSLASDVVTGSISFADADDAKTLRKIQFTQKSWCPFLVIIPWLSSVFLLSGFETELAKTL